MVLFVLLLLPILLLLLYFIVRPRPLTIPIKNRHVFITGGSIGIGLAIAKQAASEGARISLLARSLDKLEEAKQSIRQAYQVDVAIFAADVRDYDAVQSAIKEAGPIDVLVVNHGVYVIQELENQGLDVVKFMIDVNLTGSFNVIKAALPLMKDRKDKWPASIALMSSMAGQVGIYGYAAYSATKFGLRGLAESLQQEVIEDNIHVSIIFPPVTETPGIDEARKNMPELSKIIVGSGVMKAEEIGKITVDGIKCGSFSIPCNFLGQTFAIATAGVSPQRSFLMASLEVVFAGLFRFGGLLFQWNLYGIIEKWHAQKKQ
ncbi:Short-chain dehydrogenase/reductase SDR - like 10 [Theobroma cacao]|uniref:3-dehydrosphinganine reductase n=1 Tax=Theobroma cacao TaxID=3641 RepID=A0AB32W6W7_THECC|nr:PREDICTED: 3-dehydrosphinganine reductase TSC10B [Theobroma cacao]WRX20886.1 Short-chain dehydrogenase/reductase SDR - like 10 [Theobroma cacao]